MFPQPQEGRYCIESEAKTNDVEKRGTNGTHESLIVENLRCISFILEWHTSCNCEFPGIKLGGNNNNDVN